MSFRMEWEKKGLTTFQLHKAYKCVIGHWGSPLQWHTLHKQGLESLSLSDGLAGLYLLKLFVKPPVANHTHLSGNALHHHPGYRSDRAPLRVIKWALGMIQAGQGTDLILGICGLVWRLKEGHRRREKHRTNPSIFTVKRRKKSSVSLTNRFGKSRQSTKSAKVNQVTEDELQSCSADVVERRAWLSRPFFPKSTEKVCQRGADRGVGSRRPRQRSS